MCSPSFLGTEREMQWDRADFLRYDFINALKRNVSQNALKALTGFPFFYLFPEGPDGILSVFCKLNLLAGTFSADCDKLILRFLKNSNPPLELGS